MDREKKLLNNFFSFFFIRLPRLLNQQHRILYKNCECVVFVKKSANSDYKCILYQQIIEFAFNPFPNMIVSLCVRKLNEISLH